MKITSRQRLFDFIRAQKTVTIAEISAAMRMTPANARHHVSILKDQELIEIVGRRPQSGKGRPSYLISAVRSSQESNLPSLTNALLQQITSNSTPDSRQEFFRNIAKRLIAPTQNHDNDSLSESRHTQLFLDAIYRLNELNYEAKWEAHAGSPLVIFQNCPYRDIIESSPEICLLDHKILEILLEASSIEQLAKLVETRSGIPQCVFRVQESM